MNNLPPLTSNKDATFSEEQLNQIMDNNWSIDYISAHYPTIYNRAAKDGNQMLFYGEKAVVSVIFDREGNAAIKGKYHCITYKNDYDHLKVGDSLEDVKLIDPKGDYLFLYTGRNDTPKVSTHYTVDKFIIYITYNDDNEIVNIITEPV